MPGLIDCKGAVHSSAVQWYPTFLVRAALVAKSPTFTAHILNKSTHHLLLHLAAALTEVMLTGGLPPRIDSQHSAEEAYRHLFPRVIAQNHKFYKRFPSDVSRVQRIVQFLSEQPGGGLTLPNGDHLTPRFL